MHINAQLWLYILIGLVIFVPVLMLHRRWNLSRIRQAIAECGGSLVEARLVTPPTGMFARGPIGCYYRVDFVDSTGMHQIEHCYFTSMGELRWVPH